MSIDMNSTELTRSETTMTIEHLGTARYGLFAGYERYECDHGFVYTTREGVVVGAVIGHEAAKASDDVSAFAADLEAEIAGHWYPVTLTQRAGNPRDGYFYAQRREVA